MPVDVFVSVRPIGKREKRSKFQFFPYISDIIYEAINSGGGICVKRNKARILVVEDEAIIAMDLVLMLERQGCQVSGIVASGEASLEKAETELPDLVLMDITLKGRIDGVQAAREIHRRWGIPIVYVTAFSETGPGARGNGFPRLLKPFDERDIVRILSQYLPDRNN